MLTIIYRMTLSSTTYFNFYSIYMVGVSGLLHTIPLSIRREERRSHGSRNRLYYHSTQIRSFNSINYKSTYSKFTAISQSKENNIASKSKGNTNAAEDIINTNIIGIVPEDFRSMVKKHKANKAPKKLFEELVIMSMNDQLTSNMSVYSFRNLQRMERIDLAMEIIPLWYKSMDEKSLNDIELCIPMLKVCCKENRMDLAIGIANAFNIHIYETPIQDQTSSQMTQIARQLILPELAHGYASNKGFIPCLNILENMIIFNLKLTSDSSKHILKCFLKGESSNFIRKCLRLILLVASDSLSDNDFIQILASNYLRNLEFVKGAVSIDTLPPEKHPEVCFIGRSNVGKSSLINMLTNSKKLAFTSKTPGKTSEFNYFEAEGQVGPAKEQHRFYLVDVPGVGYAEVAKSKRRSWIDLLTDYSSNRTTLRLICHLVDSRHGLMKADEQCLSLLKTIPPHVNYVIILTKSDKRGSDGRSYIVEEVKNVLKQYTSRNISVILSSSESREGGASVWSEMLDAFAGHHIREAAI